MPYDDMIVGVGAAGAALAARLSEHPQCPVREDGGGFQYEDTEPAKGGCGCGKATRDGEKESRRSALGHHCPPRKRR
jgi:choline dehydrogenase-like flavoprotein